MRDFVGVDETWGAVRAKINEMAASGPAAWSAYRDFSDIANGVVMDGGGSNVDMLGNRFLAAGGTVPELFQVTNGAAWQGGRSWVTTGNAYMALKPGAVRLMWCEFVLDSPGAGVVGPDSSSLAMVITNDETLALANLCHPYVTRLGWQFQYRVGGGTLNNVSSGTWATPLVADGVTRHQFAMLVYPEDGRIVLLWPGVDSSTGLDHTVIQNPVFSPTMGALAYWQENRTDATRFKPGITRIGLVTRPGSSRVQYLTSTATLTQFFDTHLVRPSGSGQVFTLAAANTANGHTKTITVPSNAANSISVAGAFWDGASSKTVAAGTSLKVVADTVNNVWAVL